MYPHTDPAGTGLLKREKALLEYRIQVDRLDKQFGREPNSAYVVLEAFQGLAPAALAVATVQWIAFPRSAGASNEDIDKYRFQWQDEYVEWRIERQGAKVKRITFTTDFPEYYQALASVSAAALIKGIRETIPGANPTALEVFGKNFKPATATPEARSQRFRQYAESNPWNNGKKGILFLTQGANTMSALFNLVGACGIAKAGMDAGDVCGAVGGACGPNRNSDPRVCEATQNLARAGRGLCLQDPVGIEILRLGGVWKINGQQIDINDPGTNQGAWKISRNGRRAVLEVKPGLTMGDDPITTGAQVSAGLTVGAKVMSAAENKLPGWARTGQESSRVIS